jgi:hypothetical protein
MSLKKALWTGLLVLAALALPVASRTLPTSHVNVLRADGGSPIPPPIPIPPMA